MGFQIWAIIILIPGMRDKRKLPRKGNPTFAFVVDGKCESWYLSMIRTHEKSLKIDLKPELPQKKKIKDLYEKVRELLESEYDKVFWIVDFDSLNKEQREAKKGDNPIERFYRYYSALQNDERAVVIINNPCFEFWILLHYSFTSKFYENYEQILPVIQKYLPDYEKTEKFYKKPNNDIYTRLKPCLIDAIKHAGKLGDFNISKSRTGISEMHKFFESDIVYRQIIGNP